MGNKESSTESKQFIEHERLGPIRIFQLSDKNEYGQMQQIPKMEITRSIQSVTVYDSWANELRKINDAQGQELFLVPQTRSFEKGGLCGSSGIAKLSFNKFEFVLSSQIKNRNNLNKYFEQTEIWYVLYNLVRAGNKFQILKQKIGDIHPNNILINEDGQTAIISTLSIPGEIDNFEKYIEDRKAEVFLAPEEIAQQDIQKGVYNQKVDRCLAEVFSLGMTLLSAGTLEHCNDAYHREPLRINAQRIEVLLDQFSKRYTPYLTKTLRSMLQFSPEKRIRSQKLCKTLAQYEAQILDLEPFQVYNQAPQGYPMAYNNNNFYNQPYGTQAQNPIPSHYAQYVPQYGHQVARNPQQVQQIRFNNGAPNYAPKY